MCYVQPTMSSNKDEGMRQNQVESNITPFIITTGMTTPWLHGIKKKKSHVFPKPRWGKISREYGSITRGLVVQGGPIYIVC